MIRLDSIIIPNLFQLIYITSGRAEKKIGSDQASPDPFLKLLII